MNKLLIVGPSDSGKVELVQSVFNTTPAPSQPSQGIIHPVELETKHYTTDIDIWIDEYTNISTWCEEFTSDEAQEVREAIGVMIWCFGEKPDLEEFKQVVDKFQNEDCKAVVIAIGGDQYEDEFWSLGIELVDINKTGVNEFNEKLGYLRIREIVECYEWDINDNSTNDVDNNDMDLDSLMSALQRAKQTVGTLDPESRHKYAMDFINGLI